MNNPENIKDNQTNQSENITDDIQTNREADEINPTNVESSEINNDQENSEPNQKDVSLLISDLSMTDPFSLPPQDNSKLSDENTNSSLDLNISQQSKEIDLSSLPVTPIEHDFSDIPENLTTDDTQDQPTQENSLEDPFSPQVDTFPTSQVIETSKETIDISQADLSSPNSIKQEEDNILEQSQPDIPTEECQPESVISVNQPTELNLSNNESDSIEISLSSPDMDKEIDKLPNLVENSLFFDIPLNDPLHELTQLHLGAHIPKPNRYSVTDLSNDSDQSWQVTAQELANTNRWRSLVGFTRHKLTNTPKQDIDSIMKLWEFRLIALTKINLYQLASAELDKWGSILNSEYCYETYPLLFKNRTGHMIPFSILILWGRLPSFLGNITKSIDRLYAIMIHFKTQKNQLNSSQSLDSNLNDQLLLIIQLIVGLMMQIKDYSGATRLMDQLVLQVNSNVYLWSNLGRLHLMGGNISAATECFDHLNQLAESSNDIDIQLLIELNKSLLLMTQGNWDEAHDILMELYQNHLDDITVVNSLVVSKVYKGQHVDAIHMLQSHLAQPGRPEEVSIMNLCTLYELHTDLHTSKKVELLEQVHSNLGDGFPLKSFKLN